MYIYTIVQYLAEFVKYVQHVKEEKKSTVRFYKKKEKITNKETWFFSLTHKTIHYNHLKEILK